MEEMPKINLINKISNKTKRRTTNRIVNKGRARLLNKSIK